MKRPRISTRSLMLAVLVFGLFLGLGLPAAKVYRTKESHPHGFIGLSSDGARLYDPYSENVISPFWPRYLRCISGKPWKYQKICRGTQGRLEEICEFDYPDNFLHTCFGPDSYLFFPTEEMDRKIESLRARLSVAK
jgi:hypothetical protein